MFIWPFSLFINGASDLLMWNVSHAFNNLDDRFYYSRISFWNSVAIYLSSLYDDFDSNLKNKYIFLSTSKKIQLLRLLGNDVIQTVEKSKRQCRPTFLSYTVVLARFSQFQLDRSRRSSVIFTGIQTDRHHPIIIIVYNWRDRLTNDHSPWK